MTKHKAGESKAEKESKPRCDILLKNKAEYYRRKDNKHLSHETRRYGLLLIK